MAETDAPSEKVALPAAVAIGRRVGDYELVEEIARGGMGVVYRARQLSLNRMVALKVLLAGHFANETFIKRFRREAEAAASLNHPNIVRIYEVGEHEGQPYFSMELVEGRNLAELTREGPLAPRRAAQLVKTITEGVHFAHQRGLLHRDLKPSNVLVDALDVPHITDFGLAKHVDGDADLTLSGQVLGTPNYMPPEQAEPKRGPTTAASDVFSLGAILYQLLTGRAPFMAGTLTQTLRLVVDNDPVAPRLLNPAVPRDIETICGKCLEKEPKNRYASAQELVDELGRFLKDEPIQARPIGPGARLMRWCRRKPGLAGSVGAGIVLLLFIAIGSPIALLRINAEREHAENARKQEAASRVRAESAERETKHQLYNALLEESRAIVRSGEVGQRVRALEAIRRAAAISNSVELRQQVLSALTLPDLRFERFFPAAPEVLHAMLDPQFERVALARGMGPVEIRGVSDNRLLATLPASTNLAAYGLEWSGDGRFLAVKRDADSSHADWEIWEVPQSNANPQPTASLTPALSPLREEGKAGTRRVLLLRDVSFSALSFHPRLPRLIARQKAGGVAIWNLEDGHELLRFPLVGKALILRFSPDGSRFASVPWGSGPTLVAVYDAANPDAEPLASLSLRTTLQTLAWHPGGRWLALPTLGSSVYWMDAQTGEAAVLGTHKAEATTAVFTPDGAHLFTGGWEEELICWNSRTRQREFTIGLNTHTIQFSANGRRCALISESAPKLRLYSFEKPSAYREFTEDLGGRLWSAAFSPDGRWLAAGGDKRVGLWDLSKNAGGALESAPDAGLFYFTTDGRELFASAGRDGRADCFRWRIESATNVLNAPDLTRLPLKQPKGFTHLNLFSNSIVMNGTSGSFVLPLSSLDRGDWAKEVASVPTMSGISGVSPNERWFGVFRPYTTSLYVYELPGLKRVAKLPHPTIFRDFQFSPTEDELVITSSRTGAEFWNTTNWQRTRSLTNCSHLLYTPDGRGLWVTHDERTAGLYDARTLEPLLPLPTGMLPLAVSADGNRMAVSVDGRRLQLWDLSALREQFRELGVDWRKDESEVRSARR